MNTHPVLEREEAINTNNFFKYPEMYTEHSFGINEDKKVSGMSSKGKISPS
jgi:hypothetical protein